MWIYKSGLDFEKFLLSDSEYSKKYISQLFCEYDELKDSPIRELSFSSFNEYFISGNRLSYEKIYFSRRTLLRDFALKAWLGDDDALSRLERVLDAVLDEYTWALPAHTGGVSPETAIDLFASETAHAITEIISLVGSRLDYALVRRCLSEVKRRVLTPFVSRRSLYPWESMKNNWCAVCGGCVGMTAVYLIEDIHELKRITAPLCDVFDSYMESFSDDGACLEGLYYWNYGMTYLTAFLELYRERVGEDFPANRDKLKKMADFPRKCCMGGGVTVSFSDAGERDRVHSGLIHRLHDMCGAAVTEDEYTACFTGDDCGRWCKASRDIAWTSPRKTHPAHEDVSCLEKAQWAVIRGNSIAASFKGGSNGEPHNHNDIGSFTVAKNGYVLLCDLGAGEYTREYFSGKRYDIFCNSSLGHSVPIIDGDSQMSGGEYRAKDFTVVESGAYADISGAYANAALTECVRKISVAQDAVRVDDSFKLSSHADITERFVTRLEVKDNKRGQIELLQNGQLLGIIEYSGAAPSVSAYEHHEHDGSITNVTAIDFSFSTDNSASFSLIIH